LLQAEFAAFHPTSEPKLAVDSSLWH